MNVVLTGIVSSVFASVVYALIALCIRPRIEISDVICVTQENECCVYKVKVINKGWARLMNVYYTLDYCEDHDDDTSYLTNVRTRKGVITTIDKMNRSNTDYAVRISFLVDPQKFPMQANTRFIFTITATHPISNTSICKKKSFRAANIKNNSRFQTGKSMGFLSDH